MTCIDKDCKYRELNGGDETSDFYFCTYCGLTVNRGEDECLCDKWGRKLEPYDTLRKFAK